jgi:hypothetical protein
MQPLTTWICDACGDDITEPKKALVVWKSGPGLAYTDFRIVHKGQKCDDRSFTMSAQLDEMLGLRGQAWLLAWLTPGPLKPPPSDPSPRVDLAQFVDIFRRLQTPWYEEARLHWGDEDVAEEWADANEVAPYMPESLERIATEHRD